MVEVPEWVRGQWAEEDAAYLAMRLREEEEWLAREARWLAARPTEYGQWRKYRRLFEGPSDIYRDKPYDFEDFLAEVGPAPSHRHALRPRDESLPIGRGNLAWAEPERADDGESDDLQQREWLSINDIEKLTGLSYPYIYRAVVGGRLKASNMGTPAKAWYRVARADLEDWLKRRKDGPLPPPPRGKKARPCA